MFNRIERQEIKNCPLIVNNGIAISQYNTNFDYYSKMLKNPKQMMFIDLHKDVKKPHQCRHIHIEKNGLEVSCFNLFFLKVS